VSFRRDLPVVRFPRRSPTHHRDEPGAFDIIGDVHGCAAELADLLAALGYARDAAAAWKAPSGRLAIFVGDFVDRGPRNLDVLNTVMRMVASGSAKAVLGNHDLRLERYLNGQAVSLDYGLDVTVAEIDAASAGERARILAFLRSLPSHLVLDTGRLVVAHTGLPERLHGRASSRLRQIAAYGPPGAADPTDPTKRHPWVTDYAGEAAVVYGHTPVAQPTWTRGTIDIDTGCVFGGRLTALRWPEREIVSVPARQRYADLGRAL
jgi:protein phosphatase